MIQTSSIPPYFLLPEQMRHRPYTADLPQKLEEITLLCTFQPLIANASAPFSEGPCAAWCPIAYALILRTWGRLDS